MKKKRKKKSRQRLLLPVILIPALVLLLGIYLYVSMQPDTRDDEAVMQVSSRLKEMEQKDTSETEALLKSLEGTALSETNEEPALSSEEIQAEILNGDVLSDVEIRQVFQNTVILGDSITDSIAEYGFLDRDVVVSQIGMSVSGADDLIATAIDLNPSVVFFCFGANDLENYESDASAFITDYKKQIDKVISALPEAVIYVNQILPLSDTAISSSPALQYYPQYNEALIQMCSEYGFTCIDNSFIIESNNALYEPDGEHVIMSFYPMWLTNMAETAGLT